MRDPAPHHRTVKQILALGTILVSAVGVLAAQSSVAQTAETGSMVVIGMGLVVTASIVRHRTKARH